MTELLPWHWLVIGILLLVFEVLGASGFLIGIAIAALVQSLVAFAITLSWELQLVIFAANSILFTLVYWKFFRKFNDKTDHDTINDRAAKLIGRVVTLESDLINGEGKIQLGDALWKVQSSQALVKGQQIKVTGSEGMTLVIEPLADH